MLNQNLFQKLKLIKNIFKEIEVICESKGLNLSSLKLS